MLCDVNMPGESGVDLLREIRASHPQPAVIMLTGMATRRPHRPALGVDNVLEEIEKNRGGVHDRHVVDTCLCLLL